jgi:hypothetical protein
MIAHILAVLGKVVLWAGYAFAAFLSALLVYAASQGGAEVATWAITLSVCAAAIVIGFLIQYILVGNRKA